MHNINWQKQMQEITKWIRTTMQKQGFSQCIIALSGGIDSSTALTLAVKAMGKDNVYALILPYGALNKNATDNAKIMTKFVKLPQKHIIQIDIQSTVDAFIKQVPLPSPDYIRTGNIMARVRMIYLYDQAKRLNALVCGTENKSEYYLGYYTRFGDEASDIEPIRGLYKTQIIALAKHLKIPNTIISNTPTAGLWASQTDENELGFTYRDADNIMYYHIEKKLPKKAIIAKGLSEKTIKKVLTRIKTNNFKHHVPISK